MIVKLIQGAPPTIGEHFLLGGTHFSSYGDVSQTRFLKMKPMKKEVVPNTAKRFDMIGF